MAFGDGASQLGIGIWFSGLNDPSTSKPRVLVTGASGRIGRHLVSELVARRYAVRALTSRLTPPKPADSAGVEWRHHDWQVSLDFEPHLDRCVAVLHLGAEITNIKRMYRSNVEATQALTRAAEKAGINFFCYTSSVAVYGSALTRRVTEDSPVLTENEDVKSEYWAVESLRSYGRTKLLGETKLREEARKGEYIIFRPTVVVDIPDLVALGEISPIKKMLVGAPAHASNLRPRRCKRNHLVHGANSSTRCSSTKCGRL